MLIQEDNILLVTSTDVPLIYCLWHFVAMGSYRTLRLNMHDSDFPNSSSSLVSAKWGEGEMWAKFYMKNK